MSVFRRGDFWHYDFTIDGERHRGSTHVRSRAAAIKVEDKKRLDLIVGTGARPTLTLAEAADRWFAGRIVGKRSARTTAFRLEVVMRLLDGRARISDLDTPHIEEAIQARRLERTRQGRAPTNATVNHDLIDSTLRPIFRYCRLVLKVPVKDIDWSALRLRAPRPRERTFSRAEMAAWRAALPEWHRPLLDFLALYGVRLREAFFPLSAIDLDAGEVMITGRKNDRPLVVTLLEEDARDLAARYGRAQAAKIDTVWFREMASGQLRPIHWRGFQSASKAALAAAGIKDARPAHDLRHHAASAYLRATGSTRGAQTLLGHDSTASTAGYTHVSRDDLREGLRRVAVSQGRLAAANPSPLRTGTGT